MMIATRRASCLSDHMVIVTQLLAVEFGLRNEALPAGYGLKTESRALMRALDDRQVVRAHLVD